MVIISVEEEEEEEVVLVVVVVEEEEGGLFETKAMNEDHREWTLLLKRPRLGV